MNIMVTGGGGFVGGAVAKALRKRGHRVRCISRAAQPDLTAADIEVFQGDFTDYDAVRAAARGAEAIVHCAAMVDLWGPYAEFHRVNVKGTEHVLRACQELGIQRLVHTSSPSVVFTGADVEGWNESAPIAVSFDSPYSQTKAEAEKMILASNTDSLATVALRPHLVYGPGEDRLVSRLLAKARAGELRRIGGHNKKVDTTFITDAAEAHCLAVERLAPGCPIAGKAYFITSGDPRPVWDVIDSILAAAGLPPVTLSVNPLVAGMTAWAMETFYTLTSRPDEPKLTRFLYQQLTTAHWFDISAAQRDLQYTPQVQFDAGLAQLRDWLAQGGAGARG